MTASHARSQLRQCPAWSHWPGSNWPPARYECAALPDELQWLVDHLKTMLIVEIIYKLVNIIIILPVGRIWAGVRIITGSKEPEVACSQKTDYCDNCSEDDE